MNAMERAEKIVDFFPMDLTEKFRSGISKDIVAELEAYAEEKVIACTVRLARESILAVWEEREACAKIAETPINEGPEAGSFCYPCDCHGEEPQIYIANAIRSRGRVSK